MQTSSNLSIKRHLKLKPIIHTSKSAWYRSYKIDPFPPFQICNAMLIVYALVTNAMICTKISLEKLKT